jgi:hypothetical protein
MNWGGFKRRPVVTGSGWRPVVTGSGWRPVVIDSGWRPVVIDSGWRPVAAGSGWRPVVTGSGWGRPAGRGSGCSGLPPADQGTRPTCFDDCVAVLCRAVPCRAMPCYAVPCCAVLCRAMPCYAVPCCAIIVPCGVKHSAWLGRGCSSQGTSEPPLQHQQLIIHVWGSCTWHD